MLPFDGDDARQGEQRTISVAARSLAHGEAIAGYFIEDVKQFLRAMHKEIGACLRVPADMGYGSDDLVEMLYDDLAHLLRDGLIVGLHLALYLPEQDPNGVFPLTYHVHYVARQSSEDKERQPHRQNEHVLPQNGVWNGADLALLADWSPNADMRQRRHARREFGYCFDWVPDVGSQQATALILYRSGTMASLGARVEGNGLSFLASSARRS